MIPKGNKKETEITQFTMRINNDIYRVVKLSAKENKRSAAQEINYALEQYYKHINK